MHRGAVRASLPAPRAAARFPTPPPQDRRSRGRPRGDSAARLSRPPVVRPFPPRLGHILRRVLAAPPLRPLSLSREAVLPSAAAPPPARGNTARAPLILLHPRPPASPAEASLVSHFPRAASPSAAAHSPAFGAPWDCDGKRRVPARGGAFPDAPLSGTDGSGPPKRSKPPGCPASVAAPPPAVAHFPTPPPQDRRPRGRPRGAAPPGRFSLRPFAHSPTPRPHPPGAASPSRRFARYPSGR